MVQTRFHALLRAKIEETIEARAGSIASGQCADYAAYRENVGFIKGLMDALALADEIEKEYE
jgi:hypothetical protein